MDDEVLMGMLTEMSAELSKLAGMPDQLAKVSDDVGGMSARLAKLSEDVAEASRQAKLVPQIMSKLERIDDQLIRLRDDIQVTMGAAEHEHRLRKADRDEVRGLDGLVSGMQRQIARLRTDVDELKKGLPS